MAGWRSSLVRILLVGATMSFVIDLFFVPSIHLDPVTLFFATVGIQLLAMGLSYAVSRGPKSYTLIRVLLVSFVTSLVVEYVLQPSNDVGEAWTFLSILIIEVAGFGAAEALTRSPGGSAPPIKVR